MFAASIVVPTFHINLRLNANTYQTEKQVKPGNSEQRIFFFRKYGCVGQEVLSNFHSSKL